MSEVDIDLVEEAKNFNMVEFNRLHDSMNVVHSTQISERVSVMVGQMIIHEHGDSFKRSQHLGILIVDYKTYRHIGLRLSNFRKIIKWVAKKKLSEARRLGFLEKLKLDRQWKKKVERLKGKI